MTQPSWPVEGTFMWSELMSRDVEAAKAFYSKVLGWEYQGYDMGPMGTYWMIVPPNTPPEQSTGGMMQIGGPQWEGVPSNWMGYISVEDVDGLAKKAGSAVAQEPTDIPDVGRFFVLREPGGAMCALMRHKNGSHKRKPDQKPPRHGHFMWNELNTKDTEAAKKLFTGLLGWQATEWPLGEDMPPYTLFQIEDVSVAGMMAMQGPQWEGVPPHWMTYIAVDDIQACAKAIEKAGGKVTVPPTPVPQVGTFIVALDPSGAAISFMQPAMPAA
jgi:uncharacterized protein